MSKPLTLFLLVLALSLKYIQNSNTPHHLHGYYFDPHFHYLSSLTDIISITPEMLSLLVYSQYGCRTVPFKI